MARLLIVSRCSNPHGGADKIIADLCRNLPHHGWEIQLGLTQGAVYNLPEKYRAVYPDLPIVPIDGSVGTRAARMQAIRSCLSDFQPDIVLVMRVFDAVEAVMRSAQSPRLVLGVRSYEAGYLSDVKRYRDVIAGCITSGKLIANACVDWAGMDRDRVWSIAGGVRPAVSDSPREAFSDGRVRMLYAGRIDNEQKRCQDFVPFLNALASRGISFEFDFVGTGPHEESLQNQLAEMVAGGNVRFHGWCSGDELYERHYPHADLFVHFAAWEGVTIAPREAMVHRVVPVISRFDGLKAEGLFRDGVNSLTFPVGDWNSAADRVLQLMNSRDLYESLADAAQESQSGDYSFDGAIEAWDRSLRSVLAFPKKIGKVERVPETLPGRMTRLGIPAGVQSWVRSLFGKPIRHASAGSEWPTSSGMLEADEEVELRQFADQAG